MPGRRRFPVNWLAYPNDTRIADTELRGDRFWNSVKENNENEEKDRCDESDGEEIAEYEVFEGCAFARFANVFSGFGGW